MIEKELKNFKYKNEERYINERNIAALFQSALNEAYGEPVFVIHPEMKTENDSARYSGTMRMRVEPYSLRGAQCQTLSLVITLKCPFENIEEKMHALSAVNQILGSLEGVFVASDGNESVEYSFFCNLRRGEIPDPENIQGEYTALIPIEGSMHVAREGGGVLSDRIKAYVVIGMQEHEVIYKNEEDSCSFNVNNPLCAGSFQNETEYLSFATAKAVNILYQNTEICNLLRDICHGKHESNPFLDSETGKYKITLKEVYPDREVTGEYYLNSVKELKEKGVYAMIQLVLARVP